MRTTNTSRGVQFSGLSYGSVFRFGISGHGGIALKLHIPRDDKGAGLVLTADHPKKGLLEVFLPSELDNQEVTELLNVEIKPSDAEGTVFPGVGYSAAEPGAIELHGEARFLVIRAHGDVRYRVDLGTGDVVEAWGMRPAAIHAEWSLVRTTPDGRRETIYHHQPAPKGDDRVVTVDTWNKPLDYSKISKGVV